MNYLFPASFMTNTLAMTALLIGIGFAGESSMAADIGIVQGATLALFYALSANARNLVLNHAMPVPAQAIMIARLVLLFPIAGVTFWLSTSLSGVDSYLAAVLILRRCVEWLGEVHLSEMERIDNRKFAQRYFISQILLLIIALAWSVGSMPFPLLGLFLWALLPLLFSIRFIRDSLRGPLSALKGIWKRILPHLGSTAIIGVAVYVFRLLLLLILGKQVAGDLFTAFAIGGIIGSVFANALGPSITLRERVKGTKRLPFLMQTAIFASLVLGLALVAIFVFGFNTLSWIGKTPFFWGAVGFSMIGGVIMVYAQLIRHRLLQNHEDEDLFGPDVIMNILIIVSVPFLYDLFGMQSLVVLYLLSSLLAFIFYWSYQKGEHMSNHRSIFFQEKIRIIVAVMLLLPLFFQVSGGVFHDSSMYFNSAGVLRLLPIPISVIACYGGILVISGYRRASIALSYIFFTCLLMLATTVAASQGINAKEQAKFILLIQYILPMFGFVLGQIYEPKEGVVSASMEKAFLYTLAVIVPLQLLCTWLQGFKFLSPYLYLFSIYQHLQYVPVIFVSAFLIAFCRLWHLLEYRKILLILAPLMGIYAAASLSMLAISMFLAGLLGFAIYQWKQFLDKIPALLFLVAALSTWSYLQYVKDIPLYKVKFSSEAKQPEAKQPIGSVKNVLVPANASERLHYWKYYLENVTSSPKTFLIGHVEPPDRSQYPSAHNYYLDFIYNFGFLALVPLLVLLFYMLNMLYKLRRELFTSPSLISLSTVTLFLILIDNSLKVGLRQPYSGIFIFFLWGVLISRLSELHLKSLNKSVSEIALEKPSVDEFSYSHDTLQG